MKRLELLFDLDNMITDLFGTWLALYNAEMSEDDEDDICPEHCTGSLHHVVQNEPGLWELMNREGFFLHLQPLPGALEALEWAHEQGHEVKICTSPGQSVFAPSEKTIWVLKHAPFLVQNDLIICNNKWKIHGDVLLDDTVNKVDKWKEKHPNGKTMGIAWPYNEHGKYDLRADSYLDTEAAWEEIKGAIIRLSMADFSS